jgi:hypothetical protein
MKLKDLINKSYYVANGYVDSIKSLNMLEKYIIHNLNVLKEFKGVIIATTYKEQDPKLIEINKILWQHYVPNSILIDIKENRGHSFGIADSENALIDYCKENNIDWICKSSNDVIFQEIILDKEINNADFYYLEGIGISGMKPYDYDFDRIKNEYFYPQTNFYFINISKIDYLYDKDYVNETYEQIQLLENYNGKIWEYIEGWSCEDFLKNCVNRNNLIKEHIIPDEKYTLLLHIVKDNNIQDSSFKNIMIEGICHLQWPNEPIFNI